MRTNFSEGVAVRGGLREPKALWLSGECRAEDTLISSQRGSWEPWGLTRSSPRVLPGRTGLQGRRQHAQGREGHRGWNASGELVSCHLDMEEATEGTWLEEDLPAPARILI